MLSLKIQRKITGISVFFVIFIIFFSNIECLSKKVNQTIKFKKGDTNGGYGLNFSPYNYTSVIVWLHGLCGSAIDWERFVLLVNKKGFLPNTKWILPTSKFRKITAIYGNKCPAWFDITSFSPTENVEDIDGILESAKRIRNIIKSEIELGIDQSRIFLIGFSQGSAMALITSMIMRDITLGGVIGVSGWIPMISHLSLGSDSPLNNEIFDFSISDEKKQNTRVFIFHGSKDNVIPFNVFLQTSVFMSIEIGIKNIDQRIYYDIGHTITAMQGVHIMYEISKMVDPDNIHQELTIVKFGTLSNNSYSMVLKVTDPKDSDCICYKFMPCNPTKDGELSCSNMSCNCTNKLFFYDESKFFHNLKNRDFGQSDYPYTIIQAVPSEKKLRSTNNNNSSSNNNSNPSNRGNKNKESQQTDSELINQVIDKESEKIPNLLLITGRINNRKIKDEVVVKNETIQEIVDDSDHPIREITNNRVSFRRQSSFNDIMNHRYLLSMENESSNDNENLSGSSSIIDYHDRLYTSMRGGNSRGTDDDDDEYEYEDDMEVEQQKKKEKEEKKNEEQEQHEDRDEKKEEEQVTSTFSTSTSTTTTVTSTATATATNTSVSDESNTSNRIFPTKISHYNRTPAVIKHYFILDKGNNIETNMGNSGKEDFNIEQYISILNNQSKDYRSGNFTSISNTDESKAGNQERKT
ncbi:phospholipase carboxylesterase family [Cryptosporidium sp. chipmunk genotype I]|uniref:phospholipase carboxylesterase family n=1 Tax=Cryptosporidium sp. chipmunk genotype I TaxID=1280935 RepID=UPI00351A2F67|nr:phospholipase carboxylesterase family [Cryptosporidium sp. chipmunk genotype I]